MKFRLEVVEARVDQLESRHDRYLRYGEARANGDNGAYISGRKNRRLIDTRPCPPSNTSTHCDSGRRLGWASSDQGRSMAISDYSSTIRPDDSVSVRSHRRRSPHPFTESERWSTSSKEHFGGRRESRDKGFFLEYLERSRSQELDARKSPFQGAETLNWSTRPP